jgi:nitrile hydratase subunit beta
MRYDPGSNAPTDYKEESAMSEGLGRSRRPLASIVKTEGAEPLFKAGDVVKVRMRFPVGHFRVPNYIRGKRGCVEAVIEPPGINNEEEGFGRNAGVKRHYYCVAIPLRELWPNYAGSPNDGLRIEVFETWLERS